MPQAWTAVEDATAIRMAIVGDSDKVIGAALRRPWMAVNKRLCVLRKRGVSIPLRAGSRAPGTRGSYFWTDERNAELLRLLRAENTGRAAAAALGVTVGAIRCQVAALRKSGVDVPSAARPSRTSQGQHDDALRQLWADGLTGSEIGKRLGITKNAAIGRVHRLGLPARPSPLVDAKTPAEPKLNTRRAGYCAGHSATWGLITAGTVLEGTPYPCP